MSNSLFNLRIREAPLGVSGTNHEQECQTAQVFHDAGELDHLTRLEGEIEEAAQRAAKKRHWRFFASLGIELGPNAEELRKRAILRAFESVEKVFLASAARPLALALRDAVRRHNAGLESASNNVAIQKTLDEITGDNRAREFEQTCYRAFSENRSKLYELIFAYNKLRKIPATQLEGWNAIFGIENMELQDAAALFEEQVGRLGVVQDLAFENAPQRILAI